MNKLLFLLSWGNCFLLKSSFWIIAMLLGMMQIWKNRYLIWFDGVSYLDIGDAYLKGDWNSAINACWSPVYSWILGISLLIIKPSLYWELPTVKLVNFLIYLLTLVAFEFFLNQLINFYLIQYNRDSQHKFLKIPDWIWISLGYTIFIWSSIQWVFVHRDTPDMLIAGFVYLASALVLRIAINPEVWFNYLMLGGVLGLSYLTKSSMLPMAFIFIISSIHKGSNFKQSLLRLSTTLLIFLIISTPFITAISLQKGRLTFGDAGALNYAWYVSPQVIDQFWQGLPSDSGIPLHSTRQIFSDPGVQEFATPISGSYPPWYDPSYWNDGLKPKFNLYKQWECLIKNLIFCWQIFGGYLFFGFTILASVNEYNLVTSLKNLILNWRLLLISIFGLSGFILLTDISGIEEPWGMIQTRYIAAFIVTLFAAVFSSIKLLNQKYVKSLLIALTFSTVILTNINLILETTKSQNINNNYITANHVHWQIANNLKQLGIQPGDKVALVGQEYYYWARLAKVKIIASISFNFLSFDPLEKSEILDTLKNLGVKAIIQPPPPPLKTYSIPMGDWQKLANTRGYIYLLK